MTIGLALLASAASAQIPVTLPGGGLTTTLTAVVSDQANVSVPDAVTFFVDDATISTDALAAQLRVENIVVPSETTTLRILAKASAPTFAPPRPGATTWSASDVTWKTSAWTSATSAAGQLTHDSFTSIATCSEGAPSCGTSSLVFTLAPKKSVASGEHQLLLIWKIESLDQ